MLIFFSDFTLMKSNKLGGNKPTPRAGHSSALFGDRLFIFAGEDAKGNSNEIFAFDFEQLSWL
jgi:hypothetical protein